MHKRRSILVLLALGFAFVLASSSLCRAQDYPNRPIRIVVPYTAGGTVDILARTLGQILTDTLGWQFVIDNRPGAGGNLGTDLVAKSAPDGYTLLFSTSTPLTTNLALYKSVRYSTERDFDPVILFGDSSVFVVAKPSLPAQNIADVIALAKQNSASVSIGSSGYGTLGHFLAIGLNAKANGKIVHVPYRGGVPAITAVAAGDIPLAIVDSAAALPFVKNGTVRALATSGRNRSPTAPDLMTMAESDMPDLTMVVWIACMAPKGTPPEILRKLYSGMQDALKTAPIRESMGRLGLDTIADVGLEKFADFIRQEIPRWRQIVQESGLQVE
jgi:tripartite-type tricarboxylate transporter receptor subunit TctC